MLIVQQVVWNCSQSPTPSFYFSPLPLPPPLEIHIDKHLNILISLSKSVSFENSVYITKPQPSKRWRHVFCCSRKQRTPGSIYHVSDIRRSLEGTTTNNFKHGQEKLSTVPRVWTSGEALKPS